MAGLPPPISVHHATRRLTISYVLALSILAALVVLSYLILRVTINRNGNDVQTIIDIARQQQLAVRGISRAALALNSRPTATGWQNAQTELYDEYVQWLEANRTMRIHLSPPRLQTTTGQIIAIRWAELTPAATAFDTATQALLQTLTPSTTAQQQQVAQLVTTLIDAEAAYLEQTTAVVNAYEQDIQRYTESVQHNAVIILVIMLAVLGFQGVFIFHPVTRRLAGLISSLVQNQSHMADREIHFRRLAEATFEGIAIHKGEELIHTNTTYATMFGYTLEEVLANRELRMLTPESMKLAASHLLTRDERAFEVDGQRKDGTIFPVEVRNKAITSDGQILHIMVIRDISERKAGEEALVTAHAQMEHRMRELEIRTHELTQLTELADLLQSSQTMDEADMVLALSAQSLFPDLNGALYRQITETRELVPTASWGNNAPPPVMTSADCMAIQLGHAYHVAAEHGLQRCVHAAQILPGATLCLPLIFEGDVQGVLTMHSAAHAFTEQQQQLAATFTDYATLTLANLRLRAELVHQSERDALTGLANRRMMTAALHQILEAAQQQNHSVGIIMLDIDHYKRFNDTYGHTAGDAVLRDLAAWLQTHVRDTDLVCRYGGEEFTIILPGATLETTYQRAEQLRQDTQDLALAHENRSLGTLTISLGVAVFPEHGTEEGALIEAADAALYTAKRSGRNQVVRAIYSTRSTAPHNRPIDNDLDTWYT